MPKVEFEYETGDKNEFPKFIAISESRLIALSSIIGIEVDEDNDLLIQTTDEVIQIETEFLPKFFLQFPDDFFIRARALNKLYADVMLPF